MLSLPRLVLAWLLVFLLLDPSFGQTINPPPVPPSPPPPVEPPAIIPSNIRLPVSSDTPDLSLAQRDVPEFCKGHISGLLLVIPPISADADFEIWRDKVGVALSGNTLTASVHVYYWLMGEVLFIPGQCGAQGSGPFLGDEETREVIVTADSRLKWHRDWHIETQTTVRPFRNLNRCIVTRANKDITDHFNKAGEGLLQKAAAKFDERIAVISNFQAKAREMWLKLQEPIKIRDRTWLMVQPLTTGAGEIGVTNTTPQTAETVFELTAQPKIIFGDQPSPGNVSLPALEPLAPGPSGLHINTDVEMSFEEANRIIKDPSTGVIGAKFESGRRRLTIKGARIYGTGPKVAVELEVEGEAIKGEDPKVEDVVTAVKFVYNRVRYFFEKRLYHLKGKIFLVGTPQYSTGDRQIVFPDLEYDLNTENIIARIASWILKTKLTEQLRVRVKFRLGDKLDSLKENLSAGLNRSLGSRARLTGQVDSLRVEKVFIAPNSLNGRVALDGTAALNVSWKQ